MQKNLKQKIFKKSSLNELLLSVARRLDGWYVEYTLVSSDFKFSRLDIMGSGIFPDFSILFLHYCIYVFLRLKTSFYDTFSISIEILSAIVSFGSRSTQASLLSV